MTDPLVLEVCERLRSRRKSKGLRQKDLAKMMGVTSGTISDLERGRRCPHMTTFSKWAKALDMEYDVTLKEL